MVALQYTIFENASYVGGACDESRQSRLAATKRADRFSFLATTTTVTAAVTTEAPRNIKIET